MDRPNILFILTDEQRYDCLGCYGNKDLKTPNIDALARDAVRFEHSYVPYAVCTPSRYSMLTGLYAHQHRGRTNKSTLAHYLKTYPRILAENGYKTRAVGKMHFIPTYMDVGFQSMKLAEQAGEGRLEDDYHRELHAKGMIDIVDLWDQRKEFRDRAPREYWESFGAVCSNLDEKWHSTTWIGDRAVRALEQWSGAGNMLMASFIKPHHPFDPPASWAAKYDPDALSLLPGWLDEPLERDLKFHAGFFPHKDLSEKSIRKVMAYYYATIGQIDMQVGRLIETLKKNGQYDNTLIIYTSDHGDYVGFHHMLLKQNYYYDPIIRVPLIVKFPGNARAGELNSALINNIDLAPTMLRAAGIEPPPEMIGMDLADPAADRPFIFSEYGQGDMYMARSRTHKLMWTRNESQSLFIDMLNDPLEMENRIGDPALQTTIEEYKDAIARWFMFDAILPVDHSGQAASVRRVCHSTISLFDDDYSKRLASYFDREMAPYLKK
ncbi:MAG: Arylsulfatase [candidate division BRC1 bacterium ADurb.BinA364]|nr:MAG: Arylsulfatase [candidate division BRC1 bacterium ADurb.BinA364]